MLQSGRACPQFANCLQLVKGHRVAVQNNMADSFERTSRVYRAAERKNEPELNLKSKKKELYAAIEDMFKYVKHLKATELEKQLRYTQDIEPTLRKKRLKAYCELSKVHNAISKATWDKKYKRPRE